LLVAAITVVLGQGCQLVDEEEVAVRRRRELRTTRAPPSLVLKMPAPCTPIGVGESFAAVPA